MPSAPTQNIAHVDSLCTINMESILKLAIPLICITAIVWLFLAYSKPTEEKKANVHVRYILGYAVLIIIALVDYICIGNGNCESLIDMISFGATLSSLIMSVLAIIYTLTSESRADEQLTQIKEANHKLSQTAEKLGEFRTIAESIHSRLDKLEGNINTRLSGLLDSTSRPTTPAKEDIVNEFVSNGSPMGMVVLLACCYSEKTGKEYNFDQMGHYFTDFRLYARAYMICAQSVGILRFEGINQWRGKVTETASNLEAVVTDSFRKYLSNENPGKRQAILKSMESITNFFNQQHFTI